jgi:hypothetical protein
VTTLGANILSHNDSRFTPISGIRGQEPPSNPSATRPEPIRKMLREARTASIFRHVLAGSPTATEIGVKMCAERV